MSVVVRSLWTLSWGQFTQSKRGNHSGGMHYLFTGQDIRLLADLHSRWYHVDIMPCSTARALSVLGTDAVGLGCLPQNVEKAVEGGLGGAGVQVVRADVLDPRCALNLNDYGSAPCLFSTLLSWHRVDVHWWRVRCSSLRAAMQGVDAVIITTGYSGSLLNPGGFKKIDQEVMTRISAQCMRHRVVRFVYTLGDFSK